MKTRTNGKNIRIAIIILGVFIFLAILVAGAKFFNFLTIIEQVYFITFLIFLFIFAKSIAGYSLILKILNIKEDLAGVKNKIKNQNNSKELTKTLEEIGVLAMAESMLVGINTITTFLYDLIIVFSLGLIIVSFATVFNIYIMYAAILGAITVGLITWIFDTYTNFKVNEEILKEAEKLAKIENNKKDE